jgi:single-stranded DNA-binding protein
MSFSTVTLSGTIKSDAQQRFTPNNTSVITVMINVLRYDNKTKQEKSYPVKVNLWGDSYTDLLVDLKAGTRVVVSGRLQIDQFNNKEGKPVRLLVVEASRINMLDEIANAVNYTELTDSGLDMDSGSENSLDRTDAFADQEVPF